MFFFHFVLLLVFETYRRGGGFCGGRFRLAERCPVAGPVGVRRWRSVGTAIEFDSGHLKILYFHITDRIGKAADGMQGFRFHIGQEVVEDFEVGGDKEHNQGNGTGQLDTGHAGDGTNDGVVGFGLELVDAVELGLCDALSDLPLLVHEIDLRGFQAVQPCLIAFAMFLLAFGQLLLVVLLWQSWS